MDKAAVKKTQEMWREYPNAAAWIKTISEPARHMIVSENKIVQVDPAYIQAVESLSYLLLGKTSNIEVN